MSAAKKKGNNSKYGALPPLLRLLFTKPWRQVTVAVALCGAVAGGAFWMWLHVGDAVVEADIYQVTPEEIAITPVPEWIHSDIKREAIKSGSLDGKQSLLDDGLTERVARAFSLHPWVVRVESVRKSHPARVEVALIYRRPVCMVATGGGLVPVDADGFVLPRADFSPVEARRYPRLEGIRSVPLGPDGTRWGDDQVHAAAQIAAALLEDWDDLGLEKIAPSEPSGELGLTPLTFELFSTGGSRVLWGHAPTDQTSAEIPTAEKLARLKQYVAENGSLEGPNRRRQEIDVRQGQQLRVAPRTAQAPKTEADANL